MQRTELAVEAENRVNLRALLRQRGRSRYRPCALGRRVGPASLAVACFCSVANAQMIYWTDGTNNTIQRATVEGADIVTLISSGLDRPDGIAIDPTAKKMYWAELGGRIQRADLDGNNLELVVDAGGSPRDVALDLAAGKVYWVHATSEGIQRSDFNGANFETVSKGGQFSGATIAIDSSAGKLYWGGGGAVHRMNLDGSSPEFFVVSDNGFIRQIDLDFVNQNIYWANEQFQFIARSGFGGNPNGEVDIFQTNAGEPLDVKVDPINEVFYWTERTGVGSGAIRRFDFDGQNMVSIIPSILTDPRGLALGPAPGETPAIPAVSTWGMSIIVLSILTTATVILSGRRKRPVRFGRVARVL